MPKKKELSTADRIFIQEKVKGISATQAYIKSHPNVTYDTARVEGCRMLAKPSIKSEIDLYLQKHGGGADIAAKALGEQLKADRPVVTNIKTGEYITVKDNAAINKAIETTFKAVGILRQEDRSPTVTVNLPPIDSKIIDRLEQLERKAQAEDIEYVSRETMHAHLCAETDSGDGGGGV